MVHRRRRWTNVKQTVNQRFASAGYETSTHLSWGHRPCIYDAADCCLMYAIDACVLFGVGAGATVFSHNRAALANHFLLSSTVYYGMMNPPF